MPQKIFSEPTEQQVEAPGEDLRETMLDQFSEMHIQLKQLSESLDDAAAGLRLEMGKNSREMVETRALISRLQNRVDNQLMAMILANLASGVGVAALVIAGNSAF